MNYNLLNSKSRVLKPAIIVLIVSGLLTEAFAQSKECKVTYLANAGFLVETAHQKMLFDALHFRGNSRYHQTRMSLLDSIVSQTSPFNNIDILFVSHNHSDHHDDSLTLAYLARNKSTTLVMPPQVYNQLSGQDEFLDSFNNQIIVPKPDSGCIESFQVGDVRAKAAWVKHGKYTIQNYLYILNAGGIKIMHTGDSFANHVYEVENLNYTDESVDLALINATYGKDRFVTVRKEVNPREMVFFHNQVTMLQGPLKEALVKHPQDFINIWIPFNSLETKTFSFTE